MAQKAKRRSARAGGGQRAARKVASKPAGRATARRSAALNPLLAPWKTPFAMPPFERIEAAHFLPAMQRSFKDNLREITRIAGARGEATFANTIEALERCGKTLERASAVFFNLAGADTTPELQALERTLAPLYAKHGMAVHQNPKLFKRVDTLMRAAKRLDLSVEQTRVLERYHRAFVRAGANLPVKDKARLAAIAERTATLATQFNQNLLADEQAFLLVVAKREDLAGLPESVRAAAAQTASERGHPGKFAFTLARSSVEPFLQYASRRDLREKVFKAWVQRGANGGKTDNRTIVGEILRLRAERAHLLGFKTPAQASLEFSMAKTPTAVRQLLMSVWGPARAKALEERDALRRAVQEEGGNFELAAWDWRYYAEKVRKAKFKIDEAEIKPYLQLENVIVAAFDVAHGLFGLSFTERKDVPVYHPDVRAFEVRGSDGRHVGLFLGDYFARPSKRSGAWMSSWREQQKLAGEVRPVVVNVMNFSKAAPGRPALLSMDEARTLFHEFGHALHGLLSDVTYPAVSGTRVERDFVELPSQLYEHWLESQEVLRKFAKHFESNKPFPQSLLRRLKAVRNFNQGFATVEYLAAAIVDIDMHALEDPSDFEADRFEAREMQLLAMPAEIVMRHRIPHFQHIIGGYAAGYYSYLWSEVMDADAFRAFEEHDDVFDAGTAKRLRDCIYAAGGSQDPADAYIAFRGRLPAIDALLEKRGLKQPATEAREATAARRN
jgi:peptidyl-dipeptidase Dcp